MVKKTLIGTEHERMFFDRWEIKLEGLTHEITRMDESIRKCGY